MMRGNERGFTLPELIVTTVVLVVLAGLSTLVLAPKVQVNERLDAERRMGVAMLIQGMNRYITDSGELPMYVPDKETNIGTSSDEYDACLATSEYLPRVPLDPKIGVAKDKDSNTVETDVIDCDDIETAYSAGYTIQKKDGRIMIGAGLSDGSAFTLASAQAPAKSN